MKEADLTLKDAVQAVKRNIGPQAPAATQMSAAREVFKLSGAYPSKAFEGTHRHSHVHLALVNEMAKLPTEELLEIIEDE